MIFDINWGPRAGFANTGTIQSVAALIDLVTTEGQTSTVSLNSTALVVQGTFNGQSVTVQFTGSGFSQSGGGLGDTGTITGIEFFAGNTLAAGQSIITVEANIVVAEINAAFDADNNGGDIDALELFFTSLDWTYAGTGLMDNFPEGVTSSDGVPLNLMGDDSFDLAGGNDLFFAGDGNDTVLGGGGFDTIDGGAGDDSIDGGAGADLINGGEGNDTLNGGVGYDVIYGDAGNDVIDGGATPDRLFGGDGNDTIYAGSNFSLTVDGVFGGEGNDMLFGQAGYDLLDGGEGDDVLDGGNQADNLLGGAGDDEMLGGQGLDRLFGGTGNDTGFGGTGTDGLFGEEGDDLLNGGTGNDRFFGGSGNDTLNGNEDNDTIYAGSGFDVVVGGEGNDLLFGNFNADVFVFDDGHGNDTIADFDAFSDLEDIMLTSLSTITDFMDLMANHVSQVGANVIIDTGAGNSIQLNNVHEDDLHDGDFIF